MICAVSDGRYHSRRVWRKYGALIPTVISTNGKSETELVFAPRLLGLRTPWEAAPGVQCASNTGCYKLPARSRAYPIKPLAGSVNSQAHTIRSTTVQRMPLKRFTAPTPMMEVEMTCVVESGIP